MLQRHLDSRIVVHLAPDSRAALSFLAIHPCDLLISDIRMPEMDGIALLHEVKRRWPKMAVIMFSAAGHGREVEARSEGAFAFLNKPIDGDELLAIIEAALGRNDLVRQVRRANTTSFLNSQLRSPEDVQSSPSDQDPYIRP
jgi:DNA-binding NtrC family response regulator